MRAIFTITVAVGLIATTASADTVPNCVAAWSVMSPAARAKTDYHDYSTMCEKSSYTVPAASSASAAPAGATGKCKDGTWTMATTHSGACPHHGGVDSWLPGH